MKYCIETYGCTMNFGEGRRLSRDMASMGHSETDSAEKADIVILNTCTVVETTEKRMISRIGELKKAGKQVIVVGCMAKAQPQRIEIRLPDSIILPPDDYHSFPQAVESKYGIAGPPVTLPQEKDAILPIAQGCLGNCSYCITKFARGDLRSYPADQMVSDFNDFIDRGAREVLITAQDTACYGFDTGTTLPDLLGRMLGKEGDYRVRIGMMNPNHLKRVCDGLMSLMDDERMYRFIHVPVQSGSDTVLRRMRRGYNVSTFMEIVDRMRSQVPDISIATDIITGFPGETDEDHEATKALMKELRADTVNITRFSPRPGTDAQSMEQVHGRIVKERSSELTELKNSVEYDVNSRLVGSKGRALVTENGKEGVIARTGNYRPVVIREPLEIGEFIDYEITECRSTYLVGRML